MGNRKFTVWHPKAREPLIIEGSSLKAALKKEGLNPDVWQKIEPKPEGSTPSLGSEPTIVLDNPKE